MKEPKTGKLFCVNCNVYVVSEAEYEAAQAAAKQTAPPATITSNSSAAPTNIDSSLVRALSSVETPPAPSTATVQEERDAKLPAPTQQPLLSLSSHPVHREHVQVPHISTHPAQSSSTHRHKHELDADAPSAHAYVSRVTHNALIALAQKLEELSSQCQNSSLNPEQALVKFRMLAECANALGAVQRTSSELDRRQ